MSGTAATVLVGFDVPEAACVAAATVLAFDAALVSGGMEGNTVSAGVATFAVVVGLVSEVVMTTDAMLCTAVSGTGGSYTPVEWTWQVVHASWIALSQVGRAICGM